MEYFDGFPIKVNFHGQDWELDDCKIAHETYPDRFEVPEDSEKELVVIGSLLRLHFIVTDTDEVNAPRAERMWVEVCKIDGDIFYGHLTNEPAVIKSLDPGDVIQFQWNHVAQIYVKKDDPRHPENA